MDDLNHDGKVDIEDARYLVSLIENSPELAADKGGLAAYGGTLTHGPFVHIDVRGMKARW